MNKRTLSTGATAFLLSILFIVALCGFAVADHNMSTQGFGPHQPIFTFSLDEDTAGFSFMGMGAGVPMQTLDDAAFYARRMSVLLPPRLRLAAQLLQSAVNAAAE